ncbi:MAG: LTA synthase family protein, partial [Actinobacteria bacterium]|nr:LTA synthase family protein [Actinomycetota bacterium]
AVGIALMIGWCVWRRGSPVAVGAGLGIVGFFFFTADIFGSNKAVRLGSFVVVIGFCALAAGSAARRTWVATGAALLGVAYIAVASVSYASWRRDHRTGLATVHTGDAVPPGTLPNVYYFVLDGYARDDVLHALYPDDDATAFNDALAGLGFRIDPAATANYPQTAQSVPSTLEQALIIDERTPVRQVQQDRSRTLKGANRTVAALRELGYQYVQTDVRRHDALRCDESLADGCLAPRSGGGGLSLGEVDRALVELTPIGPMVLDRGIVHSERADLWPADVVDGLIGGGWLTHDRPVFVYAHFVAPHPPYVRTAECDEIEPVGNLGEGWEPKHRSYYLGQVECLRTELPRALRRLVAADPTAIVVLQADHGPGFGVDLTHPLARWTNEMLRTRFGAFRAWRLPAPCLPTEAAASSLVNTFRVVEACVRAANPDLLAPQSYLTGYGSSRVEPLPPGVIPPGPGSAKVPG